jgi:hypothetical protein
MAEEFDVVFENVSKQFGDFWAVSAHVRMHTFQLRVNLKPWVLSITKMKEGLKCPN